MAKATTGATTNDGKIFDLSGGAGHGRPPETVWVNEPKRLQTPFGMMEGYRGPHLHPFGFFAFQHSGWPVEMPDPIFEVKATAKRPLLDFEMKGGGYLVSERARDLLLAIDSGAWTERAATVKFISRGKVQREERRYLMDVIRWLDALDYERSGLRIEDTPYGRREHSLGGIVFKASAIEGCAFFRRTGNQDDVYVTSAARALLEASGFTGIQPGQWKVAHLEDDIWLSNGSTFRIQLSLRRTKKEVGLYDLDPTVLACKQKPRS